MTLQQWGAVATATLAGWTCMVVWVGLGILLRRLWLYRHLNDHLWDIRFMSVLWALALTHISFWSLLTWLDAADIGWDLVPDMAERWPISFLVWVFVASATNYSLIVGWRLSQRKRCAKR